MILFSYIGIAVVSWFVWTALPKKFQNYLATAGGVLLILPFTPLVLPYWLATEKFGWDKNSFKSIAFSMVTAGTFYGVILHHVARNTTFS